MRAVLLADTHVPSRAKALPPALWDAIDAADVVLHAGDWIAASLVTEMSERARLVGCYGNNDGEDVRAMLPVAARVTLGGVRVAVVHETGQAAGRERRMERAFPDVDLLVFGHSHIPWDSRTPSGLRLLNPGSPTDKRRQPVGTWIEASFSEGDVELAWRSADPAVAAAPQQ